MASTNQAARMERELLLLRRNGFMGVADLARQCHVSEMTMRRDLRALAQQGKVRLVYGGATYAKPESALGSYLLNQEKDKNRRQKAAIAREAARLVQPNDVILLDSGSTIEAMAQFLGDEEPRTILCYSLNIFEAVLPLLNSRIVLTGGVFHRESLIVTGPEALGTLQRYGINRFFFGAGGVHATMAVTCNSDEAVPIKRAMFPHCLERILMLDSSKFGRITPYHLAKFDDITTIITDDGIADEYRERIESHGVHLIVAKT